MKAPARSLAVALVTFAIAGTAAAQSAKAPSTQSEPSQNKERKSMDLGNFSVSLAVRDIKASKAFCEKLDFKEVGGKLEQNWIVLQNGNTKIGLFQGMLDKNIMTFNPGWTQDKQTMKDFQDVRELQRILKSRGLKIAPEANEATDGPAHFMITDPDGNTLLIDQHVPSPKR